MTEQPNREYWNVMKGIGIILVVMGHTCLAISRFIYLFHLPLFFFISGYLYSEEKYGDDPYLNFISKIKTSWIKYVLVYWVYIWFHNVFYNLHMIENQIVVDAIPYNLFDVVDQMVNAVFGMADEQLAGPLWFVPVLVMGVVIFGVIVYLSKYVEKLFNQRWVKFFVQFVMVVILGAAGYWIERHGLRVSGNMQVAFIVMPFIWAGYLCRNTSFEWERILNLPCAIVAFVILCVASVYCWLDLILEVVYPTMHIMAFIGIYLCLYIGKAILNLKGKMEFFRKFVEFEGRASFTIMALHFLILRITDLIYTYCSPKGSMEAYINIPVAYSSTLWPLYLIVGLGVPSLVHLVFSRAKLKI